MAARILVVTPRIRELVEAWRKEMTTRFGSDVDICRLERQIAIQLEIDMRRQQVIDDKPNPVGGQLSG